MDVAEREKSNPKFEHIVYRDRTAGAWRYAYGYEDIFWKRKRNMWL